MTELETLFLKRVYEVENEARKKFLKENPQYEVMNLVVRYDSTVSLDPMGRLHTNVKIEQRHYRKKGRTLLATFKMRL